MRTFLLCALCTLGASSAFAQTTVGDLTSDERTQVTAGSMTRASGSDAASIVKAAPLLSLDASRTDKKVTGQIGFQLRDFTLTLGAAADISGDSGPTTLATLDGLADKTTGTLNILWSHWKTSNENVNLDLAPACRAYAKALGVPYKGCTIEDLRKDKSNPAAAKALKTALSLIDPGTIYFFGANAKVAPESFKFVSNPGDPNSVANETTEHHTSWSAGAVAGVVLSTNTTLAAMVSRQVAFTAGTSGQICVPAGTQSLLSCQNHVLAAPGDPDRSNVVSFEIKQFSGEHFAVAPRVEFDVTKSAQAIALPVYLFHDGNGGLNGGITIGWRSDTRAVTASAFVGDVLTLITK